jgi:SAM-dependent methyltransferase
VHPALVREWLRAQAAGGYLRYHPDTDRFELPDATAAAVLGPAGPMVEACIPMITSMAEGFAEFSAAFSAGQGYGWHRRTADHWAGSDAFSRLVITPELIGAAIASIPDVATVLETSGSVADIGCGYGAPTMAMATLLPSSVVWGFDYHDASIMQARASAGRTEVDVRFDVAGASDFPTGPGQGWDLITFFDSLHDLGDPVGALRRARTTLAPGGAVLLFEPLAADAVADNLTPTGRMLYAISTLACTPNAVAQEIPGSVLLGAQSGESALRAVAAAAGFGRIDRLAVPLPLNLVLALRP